MKKMFFNFLSYLITLLLLIFLFAFFLKPQQMQMLLRFSPFQIAVAVLLSLGAYIGNGVEYFFIGRKIGFALEKKDIVLLPLAMNLAGTLIPFQGAMAYQLFFFKKKYDMAISKSCSVTFFLYLLSMFFSGIAGLFIGFSRNASWLFLLISALFLLSPLGVILAERILKKIVFPLSFMEKIRLFFLYAVSGIAALWTDFRLLTVLILIYLARLLCMIFLFAWIAKCMGMQVTFFALLLLNLWNMLSLLIKITPNNLGISQLVSGALFAMIGFSMEQGIILSLGVNMIFIAVALTLGTVAAIWNWADIARLKRNISTVTPQIW